MRGALRWLGAVALLCAVGAQAHIVYGTKSLHALVVEADLVLRARILASGERVGLSTEAGPLSRPAVEAQVLDVLKGSLDAERVLFAQHGHGVAIFEPGDEALLFLLRIERSRELDALAASGALQWVSLQEHDDAYRLRDATRERLLGAVTDYVSAAGASPDAALLALRRATLALLGSGDPDLAASALRDLVLAPDAALLSPADLPVLLPLLDDPGVSMGVRAALLTELARRRLVEGDARWLALLAAPAPTRDRVTAIRAAGASALPGTALQARLVGLLSDPEPELAAAAAAALGRPGDALPVEPLARTLEHGESRVRMAAIRSLGRIGTPAALQALSDASSAHPDAATRRRARAELAKLGLPAS